MLRHVENTVTTRFATLFYKFMFKIVEFLSGETTQQRREAVQTA